MGAPDAGHKDAAGFSCEEERGGPLDIKYDVALVVGGGAFLVSAGDQLEAGLADPAGECGVVWGQIGLGASAFGVDQAKFDFRRLFRVCCHFFGLLNESIRRGCFMVGATKVAKICRRNILGAAKRVAVLRLSEVWRVGWSSGGIRY